MEEGGFEGKEETLGLGTKNVGDGEGGAVVETINMLHTPCAARCAVEPVILTLLPPTHAHRKHFQLHRERERERGDLCVCILLFLGGECVIGGLTCFFGLAVGPTCHSGSQWFLHSTTA